SQTNISPLCSTLIRLTAGMLILVAWLMAQRQTAQALQPLRDRRVLGIVTVTAFFSTYLGIWLQQIALKFTEAGIAQSLNATSPLFVLPVAIATGDRVSPRAIFGAIVAIGGIWLLFSA
ncbi:MAG: DMT family transporter, partial [Microcoleus sp. SIO2G3]|nr:DMT family transporter [Microcoleus sp. SIO2G3]